LGPPIPGAIGSDLAISGTPGGAVVNVDGPGTTGGDWGTHRGKCDNGSSTPFSFLIGTALMIASTLFKRIGRFAKSSLCADSAAPR
jgi:hypothetical protein